MRKHFLLLVLLLVAGLSSTVCAGEYYFVANDKAHWWYWDDNPKYEVQVPAKADTYSPRQVFGERSLDITLTKLGPLMRVSSVAKVQGGYAALKDLVTKQWQHVLTGIKVTTESEITTEKGVKAKFLIASGKTADGVAAMVRFVAYFKDNSVVFLQLFCDEKAYTGDVKATWIKAVNTFNWR